MFVPSIRERMPIFSQRTPQGGYMQQDAEEFFNSIIQIIASGLHTSHSGMDEFLEVIILYYILLNTYYIYTSIYNLNLIDFIFCNVNYKISFENKLKCLEAPDVIHRLNYFNLYNF